MFRIQIEKKSEVGEKSTESAACTIKFNVTQNLQPFQSALAELAQRLKSALDLKTVQVVGDLQRPVRRVAIVCGAGGELLPDALRTGAEVFLTGELRFHDYVHPEYRQVHGQFEPYLAAVDLLLNCGPDSLAVICDRQEAIA